MHFIIVLLLFQFVSSIGNCDNLIFAKFVERCPLVQFIKFK
jgi:hypothetical protein